jgi:hypothetical protein
MSQSSNAGIVGEVEDIYFIRDCFISACYARTPSIMSWFEHNHHKYPLHTFTTIIKELPMTERILINLFSKLEGAHIHELHSLIVNTMDYDEEVKYNEESTEIAEVKYNEEDKDNEEEEETLTTKNIYVLNRRVLKTTTPIILNNVDTIFASVASDGPDGPMIKYSRAFYNNLPKPLELTFDELDNLAVFKKNIAVQDVVSMNFSVIYKSCKLSNDQVTNYLKISKYVQFMFLFITKYKSNDMYPNFNRWFNLASYIVYCGRRHCDKIFESINDYLPIIMGMYEIEYKKIKKY